MRTTQLNFPIGFFVLLPFIVASCMMGSDEAIPDFNEQLQKDLAAIDNYLAANNITALQDSEGYIRYVILHQSGSGKHATIDSCITANYSGKFMSDGQEFDKGSNFSAPLAGLIDGWKIGIPLMNEGDSAVLYIPSGFAYGYAGVGVNPEERKNANLIFHLALKKVGSNYKSNDRSCN